MAAKHAVVSVSAFTPPGMIHQSILTIGLYEFHQFTALCLGEAGANTNVLQGSCVVVEPKQQ